MTATKQYARNSNSWKLRTLPQHIGCNARPTEVLSIARWRWTHRIERKCRTFRRLAAAVRREFEGAPGAPPRREHRAPRRFQAVRSALENLFREDLPNAPRSSQSAGEAARGEPSTSSVRWNVSYKLRAHRDTFFGAFHLKRSAFDDPRICLIQISCQPVAHETATRLHSEGYSACW